MVYKYYLKTFGSIKKMEKIMKKINLSVLNNEINSVGLDKIRGGKTSTTNQQKSCDCDWFNGFTKDYYDSTCGCSGMGSVFADMFT